MPDDWDNIVVTGHFAVYKPDRPRLLPEFFHRLIHIELPRKTLENLLLQDGDMLIIRTSGSRDLVGTCAAFEERRDQTAS